MIRRASSLSRLSSSATFTKARLDSSIKRECVIGCEGLQGSISNYSRESDFKWFTVHFWRGHSRNFNVSSLQPLLSYGSISHYFLSVRSSSVYGTRNVSTERRHAWDGSNASFELKTDEDVVRFNVGGEIGGGGSLRKLKKAGKDARISRNKKLNELRFYRLKAKKKMNSPNPEVRMRYKLEKAKRKEAWLIEKLRKYEAPKPPPETHDPEILTEEERFYLKRTGEKKKHYVPVGRRGVFGGVVLNMHLHWKNHETVKVVCKPCRPGQVHQYAEELARLSKGVVIDIMPNDIIIFYRGKNYVQPDVMSPPDTLSKAKALEKYRYEQSLEHTSHFIEKLENELENYLEHVAKYSEEEKSDSVKS